MPPNCADEPGTLSAGEGTEGAEGAEGEDKAEAVEGASNSRALVTAAAATPPLDDPITPLAAPADDESTVVTGPDGPANPDDEPDTNPAAPSILDPLERKKFTPTETLDTERRRSGNSSNVATPLPVSITASTMRLAKSICCLVPV